MMVCIVRVIQTIFLVTRTISLNYENHRRALSPFCYMNHLPYFTSNISPSINQSTTTTHSASSSSPHPNPHRIMVFGSRAFRTVASSKYCSATTETGTPVASASFATAVAFLYPSTGNKLVTIPMLPFTSSAHRFSSAAMPSIHCDK